MLPDSSQLLGQRWRIVSIVGNLHYCWHAYIGPAMSQPLHTNSLIFFAIGSTLFWQLHVHTNGILGKLGQQLRYVSLPACCLVSQPEDRVRLGPFLVLLLTQCWPYNYAPTCSGFLVVMPMMAKHMLADCNRDILGP